MAEVRAQALNLLDESGVRDYLAAEWGKVIENIQSMATSMLIKNQDLSGDPASGSVVARRFINAKSNNYGTARTAGKANAVKNATIPVLMDTHEEILEELEENDARFAGVQNLLNRRNISIRNTTIKNLDRKFYSVMANAGTEFKSDETDVLLRINEAVVKLKKTHNDYVDGVDGSMISIIADCETYDIVRTKLQNLPSYPGITTEANVGNYHGSKLIESTELPEGVKFIVQVDGSVAQPAHIVPSDYQRIPLSKAYSLGLFIDYGTKAVMPDLILVDKGGKISQ